MKYLDKHHVSYDPSKTHMILHKEHQKLHGNVAIISDLTLKMRQYDKLVKLSVMLKNWLKSYQREFDLNPIDIGLEAIENKKQELMKDAKSMITDDLEKVKHIKGLGIRYLAGILAYAHPSRFASLRKFLHYCGHKQSSKVTNRYSRKICSLTRQIAISLIRQKNPIYYPLYLKIKGDLSKRNPNLRKVVIHEMALNRTGTFLLKEIYQIFH